MWDFLKFSKLQPENCLIVVNSFQMIVIFSLCEKITIIWKESCLPVLHSSLRLRWWCLSSDSCVVMPLHRFYKIRPPVNTMTKTCQMNGKPYNYQGNSALSHCFNLWAEKHKSAWIRKTYIQNVLWIRKTYIQKVKKNLHPES